MERPELTRGGSPLAELTEHRQALSVEEHDFGLTAVAHVEILLVGIGRERGARCGRSVAALGRFALAPDEDLRDERPVEPENLNTLATAIRNVNLTVSRHTGCVHRLHEL